MREPRVVQLLDREAGGRELGLEFAEHCLRVGAKLVVAKNHGSVIGEIERSLIVAAPQDRRGNCRRIEPIDGGLEGREEPNRAEPQQALDRAGVVPQRQHEKRVRKDLRELAADEHIPRKGVTECRAASPISGLGDELCRVTLNFFNVLSSERFPLGRSQAFKPVSGAQLDREGAVGEVEGSVLACVQD